MRHSVIQRLFIAAVKRFPCAPFGNAAFIGSCRRVGCLLEELETRRLLAGAIPPVGFNLFTDAALTTPGLVGTYIDRSLRSSSIQNDWRTAQVVAGTRIDPAIDFTANGWGSRAEVGLTHGSDDDWDDYSVQWDGYVQILQDGIPLATRSDDGSRMWIDINGDGSFNRSGAEFINNHWGTGQAATTGPASTPLSAGVYKIRIQYEEGNGGNSMQLISAVPVVRVAYLVPSNRTPQPHAVESLQNTMRLFQDWYRDQMQRNGFGSKTFRLETEPDGATPRIHVVNVVETDDYIRGDMWGRVQGAAANAGVPIWTEGQVWLLVPETHIQRPDGSIDGGVALGASWGSGLDGGVGMIGSNGLALFRPESLTDNRSYNGLIIPEIGPYPLKQDVSFAWFEGSTVSSIASSYLGAALHEMSHGFGMPHDMRNDENFHGNLLGNGLRGFRGAVYPEQYPSDDTYLSYGQAMALSHSPYFNDKPFPTDRTAPNLSTTGSVTPVDGLLTIRFTASDASGLACAVLTRNGEQIGEMILSGTNTTQTFTTPYYAPGQTDEYTVLVYDKKGNRRSVNISITPAASSNRAPLPFIHLNSTTLFAGKPLTLDAARSSDPDDSTASLKIEWDLDGDGVFDTAPTTSKTLTRTFTAAGTRLVQARLTDPDGAVSLSAPIGIRIVPTITGGSGTDSYYVRVDPADAEQLQVFRGSTPAGTPILTMLRTDDHPLSLFPGGGNDEVIIDFAHGAPIPNAGFRLNGGTGNNRLRILGTTSADSLAIDDEQILTPAQQIGYQNVSIHLGRSGDPSPFALAGLDLRQSARVAVSPGGKLLQLGSLNIAPEALVDLNDASLTLSATPETRQAVHDQLAHWISSARNGGDWAGSGLTSSAARSNTYTGLSLMLNANGDQPILKTFGGSVVTANDILVKYTWNGDVTLDGRVDASDYFLVDKGFLDKATGYRHGDLNFDGKVDASDYFLIDSAFLGQTGILSLPVYA